MNNCFNSYRFMIFGKLTVIVYKIRDTINYNFNSQNEYRTNWKKFDEII